MGSCKPGLSLKSVNCSEKDLLSHSRFKASSAACRSRTPQRAHFYRQGVLLDDFCVFWFIFFLVRSNTHRDCERKNGEGGSGVEQNTARHPKNTREARRARETRGGPAAGAAAGRAALSLPAAPWRAAAAGQRDARC